MICCQWCHYSDSSSIERKLPTTVSRADNTGDELERPLSEGIPSGNQACFAQKFPNLKSVFPISTLPITVEFPISSYDFLVIFPYFPWFSCDVPMFFIFSMILLWFSYVFSILLMNFPCFFPCLPWFSPGISPWPPHVSHVENTDFVAPRRPPTTAAHGAASSHT